MHCPVPSPYRCEVHGNRTHGFDIASGGNPSLIDTKVHNNAVGVKVYDSGRGTMLNCEVSGNKSYGVEVTTEGHPCAVHTQVRTARSVLGAGPEHSRFSVVWV